MLNPDCINFMSRQMLSEQPNITERTWIEKKLLRWESNWRLSVSKYMNKYLALAANLQLKENLAITPANAAEF